MPVLPDWLSVGSAATLLDLFERLPEPAAFVKDGFGAEEVGPGTLGISRAAQDRAVLGGLPLTEHLELPLYPGRHTGRCPSTIRVIQAIGGEALGVLVVPRDVQLYPGAVPGLAAAPGHRAEHLELRAAGKPVGRGHARVTADTGAAGRLDTAARLPHVTDCPVARAACGSFGHRAFPGAFRSAAAMSPAQVRRVAKRKRRVWMTPPPRC